MGLSWEEMNQHVVKCNVDFKESILKQAQTIKLKHTNELQKWVEELKTEEASELRILSKEYAKCEDMFVRISRKNQNFENIVNVRVNAWFERRRKKFILRFLHDYAAPRARERAHTVFSQKFYQQGLIRSAFKAFKLYAEVAGNKHYQRRLYEKINITIDSKVIEKKNQFEFLEAMVRELEEKYRIELRKKAILKS